MTYVEMTAAVAEWVQTEQDREDHTEDDVIEKFAEVEMGID